MNFRSRITKSFLTTGFSLVELAVVIGIMGIIASVSLFSYSSFNSELALTNLAYEVALTIREAQVFGSSVKASGGTNFGLAYGVRFNMNEANQFISFVDSITPVNGKFDSGEATATHTLSRGNVISLICSSRPVGVNDACPPSKQEDIVDITFLRPSLDARIKFSTTDPDDLEKEVFIVLSAPDGKTRMITIQKTGQISVEGI